MGTLSHTYALLAPPTIVINADQTNFVLSDWLNSEGHWDGSSLFAGTVVVAEDTDIFSTNVAVAGFDIGTFPGGLSLTLINSGDIFGAGGPTSGTKGGNALLTTLAFNMANSGRIMAGGGAGGNGGAASGGVLNPGSPGEDGNPPEPDVCEGGTGAAGAGGAGGGQSDEDGTPGGTGGSGGGPCSKTGGIGGDGGAIGTSGDSGSIGSTGGCNCNISTPAGQSGGASGNAVDGFSLITFTETGTITGPTVN